MLFLGSGLKINKNFSVGINMTLLFGQVNRSHIRLVLLTYNNVYNNNAIEKLEMHGINFNYGLQYTASLKNNYFLNAGVSVSAGKNYNSNYQQLAYKYTAYNTRDTISYIADDSTKTFIPGTLGLGFHLRKNK